MDLRLALMSGIDIAVPECPLIIHQPKIKEIAYLGETPFFTGVQTLCLDKRMFAENQEELAMVNNFQIVMTLLNSPEGQDKKTHVKQLLNMICPSYKISFTPRSIFLIKKIQISYQMRVILIPFKKFYVKFFVLIPGRWVKLLSIPQMLKQEKLQKSSCEGGNELQRRRERVRAASLPNTHPS